MRAFKDTAGRTWEIKVTTTVICRVYAECGIDLTRIIDVASDAAQAILSLPRFIPALCAMLRPQLTERAISDEDFADSISEELFESLQHAVFESVIDFFRPSKRCVLEPLYRKVRDATEKLEEKRTKNMQKLQSQGSGKGGLTDTDGRASAGNGQESPESTTVTARSGN